MILRVGAESGEVLARYEDKEYIVHHLFDGEDFSVSMKRGSEIIDRISMADCTGEELRVFEPVGFGEMVELKLCGTWHDSDDPLYIKAVRPDGSIAFDGHGVDH